MMVLILNIAEWLLIAIIGLCGTVAFASSGAYTLLHNALIAHYPQIGRYLIAIIWGFLALIGVFSVSFRRMGGGRLTWLAVIFALPSILAFNKLNVPGLLGLDLHITTNLTFQQVMALTLGILTAYLLLNFMRELKLIRLNLGKKKADQTDIENVSVRSHQVLLITLICALVLTAIVSLIGVSVEHWLLPYFKNLAEKVVLVGAGGLLILAIFIYWLGTHHSINDKINHKGESQHDQ